MTDLEPQLRAMLSSHGDEAPDGAGLLAAVHARSRRRVVRQRLVTGGVVGVAVLAVAIPMATTPHQRDSVTPYQLAGSGATAGRSGALEPASSPLPQAPVVATWLPSGVSGEPSVGFQGPDSFALQYGRLDDPDHRIAIHVDSARPDFRGMPARPVRVGGTSATVVEPAGTDSRMLVWERRPGQWVVVASDSGATDTVLIRVAEGLRDGSLDVTPAFRLAQQPRDYTLISADLGDMVFVPAGTSSSVTGSPPGDMLRVALVVPNDDPEQGATHVRVGKRDGFFQVKRQTDEGRDVSEAQLAVRLDGGRYLLVHARPPAAFSLADLVELAEGVTVQPGATPEDG